MKATAFLASFVVFSVTVVTGQCPNLTWIQRGNKCYFVKMEKADSYQNIALCNELNASLVSITSEEENNEVTQIVDDFWLGLSHKSNTSNEFYWFDGSALVYKSWESEPFYDGNKYWAAYSYKGKWYDFYPYGFARHYQMCSINLKSSTSYEKTPNPADIKELLVSGQCPNSTWIRRGNKCYFVKREKADLYENIALCNELNASLVSITSEAENIHVTQLLPITTTLGSSWLGLGKKSNASNEMYWFDGSPFVYKSWRGEPRFLNHKYWAAYIQGGQWYDSFDNAFDRHHLLCSINLKASTSYKKTPNPAEIKEPLVSEQCPNSTWIRRGNKCYFRKRRFVDFYKNIALCNELNASLLSITSEEENIAVGRISSEPSVPFWLGIGRNLNASEEFFWLDGRTFAYSSWTDEANLKNFKYWAAYFLDGEWNTSSAFDAYKFPICTIDLKQGTFIKRTPNPADTKEPLVSGQCPNSTWIRRGNKCYFIKRDKADLYENIALCNLLNASLVSITSEEENIQVSQLIPLDSSLWLGLGQRSNHSNEFHWFDGSAFVYNNWKVQPNLTYK